MVNLLNLFLELRFQNNFIMAQETHIGHGKFDCSLLKKFHKTHTVQWEQMRGNELVTFWHIILQPSSLPPFPFHKKRRGEKKKKKLRTKALNQRCFSRLCKIYVTKAFCSSFLFSCIFNPCLYFKLTLVGGKENGLLLTQDLATCRLCDLLAKLYILGG